MEEDVIRFEEGKVYVSKSYYGFQDKYKVVRRTPCFVVTGRGRYKIRTATINGVKQEYFVIGGYSMAPAVWAKDEYDFVNPDKYLTDFEKAMIRHR